MEWARLLTEELKFFEGNEDQASEPVDRLYIDAALESDEGLVWTIEPPPGQYDQEILRGYLVFAFHFGACLYWWASPLDLAFGGFV